MARIIAAILKPKRGFDMTGELSIGRAVSQLTNLANKVHQTWKIYRISPTSTCYSTRMEFGISTEVFDWYESWRK
ncbi:hypothetical protein BJ508DRAFT_411798 [Ascobolus immersus RN42]|uniref:Uncharacterized protein n=1 Tax=Ascobolus immersus RN42 TaxID=1160509 RepID=A0A3N4IM93_ASCIM|nr:hypothetical protein BJ508DRAFT_411798 [Ascobolus immersus RN42]